LDVVNSADTSKLVNGVLEEISQLEETRKFHQSLYFKVSLVSLTNILTKFTWLFKCICQKVTKFAFVFQEQPTFAGGAVTGMFV
jgi:hypothetical protein